MKLQNVKNILSVKVGRTGLLVKKHSPEILMVAGVVGIVTSTVLACKATLKAEDVIDEAKSKLDKIKEAKENFEEEKYSETDYKKDLVTTYVQAGVGFVKLYGPSVTLGVASIGCILGAHNIMRKRNLALIAAYKAVEQSFSDYRRRVVDELGLDKDREFKYGVKKEMVESGEFDKKGKPKMVEVKTVDPNGFSQYAKIFDKLNDNWSETSEYNQMFIKCHQNYANDLLRSRGHLFLNEVYDMLGFDRTQAGQVVGWVMGEGDDFVDFGMFDSDNITSADFVNGRNQSIVLDFNVDGVIYDLI